jgi:hypothetical protein
MRPAGILPAQNLVDSGPQPAAGAIARNRIADLLGCGETDSERSGRRRRIHRKLARLQDQAGRGPPAVCRGNREEFAALFEASEFLRASCGGSHEATSGGKALAALRAAASEHLAAILGRHAGPEAMTAFPHQLARLVCALHSDTCRP